MLTTEDVSHRIVHRRPIEGLAAVLLPFDGEGRIDYDSFVRHLVFTVQAGLTPAVNMDTGYVNLLTPAERLSVLTVTRGALGERPFIAGAYIEGQAGDPLPLYLREVEAIQAHGGTPILFQCSALKGRPEADLAALYRAVAAQCGRLLAFELGEVFAPFGQVYSLDLVRELMQIPQLVGLKHSSLQREAEWWRLRLRDEVRPDFKLYTGNDLAIDMVMYGSDYLLGLATFAPDAFAQRDRHWAASEAAFWGLNDLLQSLGSFAFRPPVPAYKHSAAQFLKLRGLIACDRPHPRAPWRPESDVAVLRDLAERLEAHLQATPP
jgi:dihydrodipicolinate synthase/N-acetylneuraminate lyase